MESEIKPTRVGESIQITSDFSDQEWRSYTAGDPNATPAHLLEWRQVISDVFGYKPTYRAAKRNGEICGVLPAFYVHSYLLGRHFISMPFLNAGGILASDEEASTALIDAGRAMVAHSTARHMELRSTFPSNHGLPALEHKVRLVVDLPESADELWLSLRSEIRNRTKVAQKVGLTVDFSRKELRSFYGVFSANMRDLGVPAHPLRFFEAVLSEFPDSAELVVVKDGSEVIGGAILIYFRDEVEVPWISSSRAHFKSCPNNILYWEMMRRACEKGMKLFDFGRSSVGTGPATFKLRWGARPVQLYWQYILNNGVACPGEVGSGNPKYKFASNIWSKLPCSVTNILGPRLIVHLPG